MGGSDKGLTPKDHPEERELAKIAKEQWEEYQSKYVPLENEWMESVARYDDPAAHERARGLALSEFRHANPNTFSDMQDSIGAGSAYRGTGGFGDTLKTINNASQVANKASLGVTDRYARGMESVIGIGQGVATGGLQGLTDVAESAVQGRIDNLQNRYEWEQGKRASAGAFVGGVSRYGLDKFGSQDDGGSKTGKGRTR
jgi:hypothetical protein